MLTGLSITGQINPFSLLVKHYGRLESVRTGGYSNYINTFRTDKKTVTDKEHTTFINMFLDRYVFCGQALYNLLNRVSQCLMKSEVTPIIIGPWSLLQLWLNLHLHKLVALELTNLSFPSLEHLEEQEEQCMAFGKAALSITINGSTTYFCKLFNRNFLEVVLY
jgi:hypothetical protein